MGLNTGKHCEIERKYLIRHPDTAKLAETPGCEVWEITQIYLMDGEGGQTRRVRKLRVNGEWKYFRTFKRRLSALSCIEDEGEITAEAYERYSAQRDERLQPIVKTRYRVPYRGHVLEYDVFPFWTDRALMEIELDSEAEQPDIPPDVRIIRDVTAEKAYKNKSLALRVPMEAIP